LPSPLPAEAVFFEVLMSSHHIVRNEQEPALYVQDAEALAQPAIAALLEWVPTILAPHDTVPDLLELGIKIDVALVPEAELNMWQSTLLNQAPITLLGVPATDDPLTMALQYLQASKHQALNIVGPVPQLFQKVPTLPNMNIVVYDAAFKYVPLAQGQSYTKWLPQKQLLQVHWLSQAPQLQTQNLTAGKQATQHQAFTCTAAGKVSLESNQPVWVAEALSSNH